MPNRTARLITHFKLKLKLKKIVDYTIMLRGSNYGVRHLAWS